MSVTLDIARAWSAPRRLIRSKLDKAPREDRALAVMMGAGVMVFVAQWPVARRAAIYDPSVPLDARLGGALIACVFILPLIAYVLALISAGVARLLGGRGTGYGARLALFWAFLAVAPVMLIQGMMTGFLGHSGIVTAVQIIAGAGFLWIWIQMLIEAAQ
jgi:hypothetical protein